MFHKTQQICQFRNGQTWDEYCPFLPVINFKASTTQQHNQLHTLGGTYVHMPIQRLHTEAEIVIGGPREQLLELYNCIQTLIDRMTTFCVVLKSTEKEFWNHTLLHDCSLMELNHGFTGHDYSESGETEQPYLSMNLLCREIEHF
jgi:hypothetical protein